MKHRFVSLSVFTASAAALFCVFGGCDTINPMIGEPVARRPNVIPEPQLRNNPRLAEGQRVFMEHCNQCHVGGAAGLAPALTDKPIPNWLIKFQVRKGIGSMPAYSESVISDGQLEDVVTYFRYLRQHPNGAVQG